MTNNRVVWSEGMLLRPQHFQQQERYLEYLLKQRVNGLSACNSGFSSLQVNEELLRIGKVALTEVSGVFPDGTIFNVVAEEVPLAIDIPEGVHDGQVYLALPLAESDRYRAVLVQDTAAIEVNQLALRLIVEAADCAGMTKLPVLAIKEVRIDRSIAIDLDFIPACLNIKVSSILKDLALHRNLWGKLEPI